MNQKYFLAAAMSLGAAISITAPAQADDQENWNGPYIGASAGYGVSEVCWFTAGILSAPAEPVDEGCQQAEGLLLGGQVGYNYRMENWVIGAEAHANWADMTGTGPSATFPSDLNDEIDSVGTITARLGYIVNNTLLYAKGGVGYSVNEYDFQNRLVPDIFGSASETRWGGAFGVGVEVAVADQWSLGLDYTHLFLGREGDIVFTEVESLGFTPVDEFELDADLITFRLNRHF